jgi:hypothetical protein
VGYGVGAITVAAPKFSGQNISAEADPGNAAIAAGIPGFLLYVAVVVVGFRRAHKRALALRRPVDLAAIGLLVITFFQWLTGSQYAVAFMPWLVLGWIDQPVPLNSGQRLGSRSAPNDTKMEFAGQSVSLRRRRSYGG